MKFTSLYFVGYLNLNINNKFFINIIESFGYDFKYFSINFFYFFRYFLLFSYFYFQNFNFINKNFLKNKNKKFLFLRKDVIDLNKLFLKKNILQVNFFFSKKNNLYFFDVFNEFSILFNKIFLKFRFNLYFYKKNTILIFLKKKIIKRILWTVIYDVSLNKKNPEFILYILKLNNINNINLLDNLFQYFILNFGIFINIIDLDKIKPKLYINEFLDKDYIYIYNNKFFFKEDIILFKNNNFIKIYNNIRVNFNLNFKSYNLYLQVIDFNYILNYDNIFINLSNNISNVINYFNFNKNLDYIIKIFLKIFNSKNTFIIDRIIDFPIKNYIYIYIYKIYNLLGYFINIKEISNILVKLNFIFIYYKFYFIVNILLNRVDLVTEDDLISELVRYYKIKNNLIYFKFFIKNFFKNFNFLKKIKKILFYKRFIEVTNYNLINEYDNYNFSFDKFPIKILNPISKDFLVMRSNLFVNLIKNLFLYLNYVISDIKIYEVGKVYYYNSIIRNSILNVRGFSEKFKLSFLIFNFTEKYINSINLFNLINDLNELLYPNLIIYSRSIFNFNPITFKCYKFDILINNRILGWISSLSYNFYEKYKLNKNTILVDLDLNFILKNNKDNNIIMLKQFLKKLLTVEVNFGFDFYILLNLIRKFFFKKKIIKYLYNVYFISEYIFKYKVINGNLLKKNISFSIIFFNLDNVFTNKDIDNIIFDLLKYIQNII